MMSKDSHSGLAHATVVCECCHICFIYDGDAGTCGFDSRVSRTLSLFATPNELLSNPFWPLF